MRTRKEGVMLRFRGTLAAAAAPLLLSFLLRADSATPPDFGGTWQMDRASSKVDDGRNVSLAIQEVSSKFKVVRVVHERDGKEITSQFVCPADGSSCEFDEGGYKAKVSLWYDGPALIVLKTDGPKADSVMQWKIQLDPASNKLTVALSHIEPSGKDETIVFDRAASK
jgi:hypothetical protein